MDNGIAYLKPIFLSNVCSFFTPLHHTYFEYHGIIASKAHVYFYSMCILFFVFIPLPNTSCKYHGILAYLKPMITSNNVCSSSHTSLTQHIFWGVTVLLHLTPMFLPHVLFPLCTLHYSLLVFIYFSTMVSLLIWSPYYFQQCVFFLTHINPTHILRDHGIDAFDAHVFTPCVKL